MYELVCACQKSKYFQYRHISEDLNILNPLNAMKIGIWALTVGQTSMKITEFVIKLSKYRQKLILLFLPTLAGSYNGCKRCT